MSTPLKFSYNDKQGKKIVGDGRYNFSRKNGRLVIIIPLDTVQTENDGRTIPYQALASHPGTLDITVKTGRNYSGNDIEHLAQLGASAGLISYLKQENQQRKVRLEREELEKILGPENHPKKQTPEHYPTHQFTPLTAASANSFITDPSRINRGPSCKQGEMSLAFLSKQGWQAPKSKRRM